MNKTTQHEHHETAYVPVSPQVAPAPVSAPITPAADTNPGFGLGVAGFVVSFFSLIFFIGIIGFVLSLLGFLQSRKAGKGNGLAIAGIVLSSLGILANILWFGIFFIIGFVDGLSSY